MPNINELKQSKFLTKEDFAKPALATIRGYERVNVALEGADPDERYVLHFNELEKGLVLNSTNGQIIAAFLGSGEFDDWIGKQIVLYKDATIAFRGKVVGGIRVRAPRVAPVTGPVVGSVGQVLSPAPKAVAQPVPQPPPQPEAAEPESDSEVPF